MEKSTNDKAGSGQQKPDDEIFFDESVCSAEFPEGCTLPASEQLDHH